MDKDLESALESFNATNSAMHVALLEIVNDRMYTNAKIIEFCQTLTDYLLARNLALGDSQPSNQVDQALAFCDKYKSGEVGKITTFKDDLAELYIQLIHRLGEERLFLDKILNTKQASHSIKSHHH